MSEDRLALVEIGAETFARVRTALLRFTDGIHVTELLLALIVVSGACAHAGRERAGAAPAAERASTATFSPATPGARAVASAVEGLLRAQQRAWNRGDLEGFMRGYWDSPDLVFTAGGRVHRGYDELLQRYRSTYGMAAEIGRLDFSDLEVHALAPEAAWALGRWRLERNGSHSGGVFTLVLRKLSGGWKIVHDHTSTDAEEP